MRAVDLDSSGIAFIGALDIERSPMGGLMPRRLPAWTRPQIPDVFMEAMVTMSSGVRLGFTTTSSAVEIDAMITSHRVVDEAPRPQVFQLVVDGAPPLTERTTDANYFVIDPANPTSLGFESGRLATIRFEGLGDDSKRCEVWLPHAGNVEVWDMRIDDNATIAAPAPSDRPTWVHYGSSISHCMEADEPLGTWPAVAARAADVNLLSLGLAGQCMLDAFVARTIRDVPADVISLKLGINIVNGDTMRERAFVPAVHGFLDTVRDGHPTTPMLVVSPIFCPSVETHPGPTFFNADRTFGIVEGADELRVGCLTLVRIRELLATLVAQRRELGDHNLHYLDGLQLFGADDEADLPDRLHPNAAGYVRIGQRFATLAFGAGSPLADAGKHVVT